MVVIYTTKLAMIANTLIHLCNTGCTQAQEYRNVLLHLESKRSEKESEYLEDVFMSDPSPDQEASRHKMMQDPEISCDWVFLKSIEFGEWDLASSCLKEGKVTDSAKRDALFSVCTQDNLEAVNFLLKNGIYPKDDLDCLLFLAGVEHASYYQIPVSITCANRNICTLLKNPRLAE